MPDIPEPDAWEEEHDSDDDNGSDWKTDLANPFEEFVLDFLENYKTKMTDQNYKLFTPLVDAVLERDWFSEEQETEATISLFAVAYVVSLGLPLLPPVAKALGKIISQSVRNDKKIEDEQN